MSWKYSLLGIDPHVSCVFAKIQQELDAVFEAKEELALAIKTALADTMTGYGYQIVNVLITDLDPDQRVKAAMNEINSA